MGLFRRQQGRNRNVDARSSYTSNKNAAAAAVVVDQETIPDGAKREGDKYTYPLQHVKPVINSRWERMFWSQANLGTDNDELVRRRDGSVRLEIVVAITYAEPPAVEEDKQWKVAAGVFPRRGIDVSEDGATIA